MVSEKTAPPSDVNQGVSVARPYPPDHVVQRQAEKNKAVGKLGFCRSFLMDDRIQYTKQREPVQPPTYPWHRPGVKSQSTCRQSGASLHFIASVPWKFQKRCVGRVRFVGGSRPTPDPHSTAPVVCCSCLPLGLGPRGEERMTTEYIQARITS